MNSFSMSRDLEIYYTIWLNFIIILVNKKYLKLFSFYQKKVYCLSLFYQYLDCLCQLCIWDSIYEFPFFNNDIIKR